MTKAYNITLYAGCIGCIVCMHVLECVNKLVFMKSQPASSLKQVYSGFEYDAHLSTQHSLYARTCYD